MSRRPQNIEYDVSQFIFLLPVGMSSTGRADLLISILDTVRCLREEGERGGEQREREGGTGRGGGTEGERGGTGRERKILRVPPLPCMHTASWWFR